MDHVQLMRLSRDKTSVLNVRMHPEANDLLRRLAEKSEVSLAACITLLIVEAAEREGIQ